MWEPVKHLRIKLSSVNVWCEQTHGLNGGNPTAEGVNLIVWSWYFSALCWLNFSRIPRNSFYASLTCVGRLWRSRHNTIDAILIQWHVNELRGILKLLRYVFMFSTRFVRTSRYGLSHKIWSLFLSAQHLEADFMLGLWWTCLRYDYFFLMQETEETISKIDSQHIFQEAFELWSCN